MTPPRFGTTAAALLAATGLAVAGWSVAAALSDPVGAAPPGGFAALRGAAAYETSTSCAPCHPVHVASWRRTFHRTMTQSVSPAAVRAPFDGVARDFLGVRSTPRREGDRFFLDTLDPVSGLPASLPVLRTVGSRRMQQYVTRIGDRWVRLSVAYSIAEGRWFHLSEAFFHPDGEPFHAYTAVWDVNCIFCHNVKADPGWDPAQKAAAPLPPPGRLDSRVAELGIACEACHGPGGEHERQMRSPLRRYAFHLLGVADPTIVDPPRLAKEASVQVCGHCHGQRVPADPAKIREILGQGDPYTPGEDLSSYYTPVSRETRVGDYPFAPRFWPDGTPRLTAYEYQGLLASACYLRGEMTCLSCHAMHRGDPHGQLRPDRPGDQMCTQCHAGFAGSRLEAHTHHPAASSGSRCAGCHLPTEVYGIMTWHPTHQVRSPDPAAAARAGRPDACTLCHSGRSIAWAAQRAAAWWPGKVASPASLPAGFEMAELPRALFAGDVVYRTLAAWRLGQPSPEPETHRLAVPLLAELLLDSFPNVRRTARASLAELTGEAGLPQALDSPELRRAARDRLAGRALVPLPPALAGWPFRPDGLADRTRLEEWIDGRQETPVAIGE